MKSDKTINLQKYENLKKIIEVLNAQQGLAFHDIRDKVLPKSNYADRTISRYLEELTAIGVVNEQQGKYFAATNSKHQFTKNDHDMSLAHSKKLIIVPAGRMLPTPFLKLDTIEAESLLSHFRSGYPQIWRNLEAYKKTIVENNVEVSESAFFPRVLETKYHGKSGRYVEVNKAVSKETLEKLQELENSLTREIIMLQYQVQHGVPLLGQCVLCPSQHITVKD